MSTDASAPADELASSATIMIAISVRTSILLTHAGRCLLWRAKFADEPRRNRWQLKRINPIALQAPQRGGPLYVNRITSTIKPPQCSHRPGG